jgi:hypothetical protein
MATPTVHSHLGASSMSRWSKCPAAPRRCKGLPPKSSIYASEGTAAHTLGETCLRDGSDAKDHLGTIIQNEDGTSFEVTEDMAENVQVYLDTIRADLAAFPGSNLEVEKRFDLDWLHAGLFGTNDANLDVPFVKLVVYDLKYGAGVPVNVVKDGKPNPQLMYYGLGAAHGHDHGEIELVIIQPRARHEDGPVRRMTLPIAELGRWGSEVLKPAALATEDPNAKAVPGDHCKFCLAQPTCPELREMVIKAGSLAFKDAMPIDEIPTLPEPSSLPPEHLGRILDLSKVFSSWVSAVEDYAFDRMMKGDSLPGWKLVRKKTNRAWADEDEAKEFLELHLESDAYERKLLTPAKAEKAFKARGHNWKAYQTDDLIVKPDGGLTLAPAYDKREAVAPTALAACEEL